MTLRQIIKKALVYSPIKYSERIDAMLRLTLLKPWIKHHQPHPCFPTREELYAHVARTVIGQRPVSFLEFGVYQGESMRAWTQLADSPDSEFVGFDSFEGLPEAWVCISMTGAKGKFSTEGKAPDTQDQRVTFVKGWFRDTLPPFLGRYSTDKQVVVHCDADIYPSTLYVLCKLDPFLKQGTIILFDDFCSMMNDFRALADYTHAFGREYEVLGAAGDSYYQHVAVRITR